MLRHIVMWKLREADVSLKRGKATEISSALEALKMSIPEIEALSVGINGDEFPGNWDIVLIADFADSSALDRYQNHPDHRAVASLIKEAVTDRSCVDFFV